MTVEAFYLSERFRTPVTILADQLITDGEKMWAEFTGTVKAVQGATVITSDRLKIFYRREANATGPVTGSAPASTASRTSRRNIRCLTLVAGMITPCSPVRPRARHSRKKPSTRSGATSTSIPDGGKSTAGVPFSTPAVPWEWMRRLSTWTGKWRDTACRLNLKT